MKKQSIASMIAVLGLVATSSQAYAGVKVAEYGDPVTGSTYRNCVWTQTYSTGGSYGPGVPGGWEYRQYNVACPASSGIPAINITAGVSFTYPSSPWAQKTCQFYVPTGYSTGYNTCDNWRIYKD